MTGSADHLPLGGTRVLEFSHMVMGPSCGVVLADLGADVIKIEPVGAGDKTRALPGSGAGYFAAFNRNKRSLAVDVKSARGQRLVQQMAAGSDVLIENFRDGALEKSGMGYAALSAVNPGLVYCSMKGFLSGPYDGRVALDEIAQMMGGLAYMTGPPGRPLRAGASVNDIGGGMFAVIAIMAALLERGRTGRGQFVRSALFEHNVFLVSPSMVQYEVLGNPPPPMPVRLASWAVYDVFTAADQRQFFLGVVSDSQWQAFCAHFGLTELANDPALRTNPQRVAARETFLPQIRALFAAIPHDAAVAACEAAGLPVARIAMPHEMYDDPQIDRPEALLSLRLPATGQTVRTPALPLEMAGRRPGVRRDLPGPGEHSREILQEFGLAPDEIRTLLDDGVVSQSPADRQ